MARSAPATVAVALVATVSLAACGGAPTQGSGAAAGGPGPSPTPSVTEPPAGPAPSPSPAADTTEPSGPKVVTSNGRPTRALLTIPAIGTEDLPVVPYRGKTDDAPGTRIQNGGVAASPFGPRGGVGPGGVALDRGGRPTFHPAKETA